MATLRRRDGPVVIVRHSRAIFEMRTSANRFGSKEIVVFGLQHLGSLFMRDKIRGETAARFVFCIEPRVVLPVNVDRRHPRPHGDVFVEEETQVTGVARHVSDEITGHDVTAAQSVGKVKVAEIPRFFRPFALFKRSRATVEKSPIKPRVVRQGVTQLSDNHVDAGEGIVVHLQHVARLQVSVDPSVGVQEFKRQVGVRVDDIVENEEIVMGVHFVAQGARSFAVQTLTAENEQRRDIVGQGASSQT